MYIMWILSGKKYITVILCAFPLADKTINHFNNLLSHSLSNVKCAGLKSFQTTTTIINFTSSRNSDSRKRKTLLPWYSICNSLKPSNWIYWKCIHILDVDILLSIDDDLVFFFFLASKWKKIGPRPVFHKIEHVSMRIFLLANERKKSWKIFEFLIASTAPKWREVTDQRIRHV